MMWDKYLQQYIFAALVVCFFSTLQTKSLLALVNSNPYQNEHLSKEVMLTANQVIDFWQKAEYSEIYKQLANQQSTKLVSLSQFVEKMQNKHWAPQHFSSDTEENFTTQITFVGISNALLEIDLLFQNRFKAANKKKQKVLLHFVYSNGKWQLDLISILRVYL